MSGFHEVRFPLRLALGVTGGPVRRTDIVNLSNGREQRNARWRFSRRSYDAGSGIKSLGDLYEVLAFFEARCGELYGFRFRDPLDWKSCAPAATITSVDQLIGTGDGVTAAFALSKTYADAAAGSVRLIAKPVAGTVTVSVNGVTKAATAFTCNTTTGLVTFAAGHVPAAGAAVRAGYEFDVPVRFATDRIEVNLSNFNAGSIPAIPITEILP
ncbi:TIGR02217 family protein [Rhizobium sp. SGZ-381]|uniref:phage distal tail protein, Rcc01695 family n=1 Tax=Rhizobium sp. SGZ-381 TaxID=3342800 RepID=UPI003671AA6A